MKFNVQLLVLSQLKSGRLQMNIILRKVALWRALHRLMIYACCCSMNVNFFHISLNFSRYIFEWRTLWQTKLHIIHSENKSNVKKNTTGAMLLGAISNDPFCINYGVHGIFANDSTVQFNHQLKCACLMHNDNCNNTNTNTDINLIANEYKVNVLNELQQLIVGKFQSLVSRIMSTEYIYSDLYKLFMHLQENLLLHSQSTLEIEMFAEVPYNSRSTVLSWTVFVRHSNTSFCSLFLPLHRSEGFSTIKMKYVITTTVSFQCDLVLAFGICVFVKSNDVSISDQPQPSQFRNSFQIQVYSTFGIFSFFLLRFSFVQQKCKIQCRPSINIHFVWYDHNFLYLK